MYIHKKTQKKLELSIGAQLFRQTNELRQKDGQDRQTDKLEKKFAISLNKNDIIQEIHITGKN